MTSYRFRALFASVIIAGSTAATAKEITPMTPTDEWKMTVAPYIWAINMTGDQTSGNYRTNVNESFSDILQHLHFGGMVWVDVTNGKFQAFLNDVYAILDFNSQYGPASIDAQNRFGILSGGISYQVYKYCFGNSPLNNTSFFAIEPYAGFRYTENDTTIRINSGATHVKIVSNQYWTDPIIGARLRFNFSKAWALILAGDIGGVNTSSQYSYNVQGVLGYSPQTIFTNTTLYLGYRLLDQHYTNGEGLKYFGWDMKLYGPMIGAAFTF